jgi:glycerol-3-phosphate acyltransferase PlsY
MPVKIGFIVVAYLLGSIPFGFLLVKYIFTQGEDIRRMGSGGIGATNVTRRAGRIAGLLTYFLDMGKGALAVMLMRVISGDDYFWVGAAAIAVILGHMFPIFLGFRGGKGVATGAGVFMMLAPYSLLMSLVLWAIVVYLSRYVSLGSIIAAAAIPLWTLIYYGLLRSDPHLKAMITIAIIGGALVVAKHHDNIKRLARGTENKIGMRIRQ